MALGYMGDSRSILPLISALDDPESRRVQGAAASALQKLTGLQNLTGQSFGSDSTKWQKWWDENKQDFLKGR